MNIHNRKSNNKEGISYCAIFFISRVDSFSFTRSHIRIIRSARRTVVDYESFCSYIFNKSNWFKRRTAYWEQCKNVTNAIFNSGRIHVFLFTHMRYIIDVANYTYNV